MIYKTKAKNKGFTLIELLVVISIIGLLSSVVFASTNAARKKAQIAVFAQNILQIQKALEVYKADKGYYPYLQDEQNANRDYFIAGDGSDTLTQAFQSAGLTPKYISQLPKPLASGSFDNIDYWVLGANFASEIDQSAACGGVKLANKIGYIFWYNDDSSFAGGKIPLPKYSDYTGVYDDEYCLTN